MAGQERVRKEAAAPAKQEETLHADPAAAEQTDLTYTDELLGDIDDLLNELGTEFVKNYVQKGGQ